MVMPASFDKEIEELLEAHQPGSVLVIGPDEPPDFPALTAYQANHPACRVTHVLPPEIPRRLTGLGRYDFGLVSGTLESLDKAMGARLIAALRDLHTRRFCVVVPINGRDERRVSHWQAAELLSFGLAPAQSRDRNGSPLSLYRYDIAEYKPTPDWLNPDHWANPELWDKYRW